MLAVEIVNTDLFREVKGNRIGALQFINDRLSTAVNEAIQNGHQGPVWAYVLKNTGWQNIRIVGSWLENDVPQNFKILADKL